MHRCEYCRHDNLDDSVECAQCGRPLTPGAGGSDEYADRSANGHASGEPVVVAWAVDDGSVSPSANGMSTRDAIERAATLTVQVRRTSVPLLAPGRFPMAPAGLPPQAPLVTAPASLPMRIAGSRRWLMALAVLVVVVVAVVTYLLVMHPF